jgi:DNA polymerase/3'-5' exonuclease PolX
VLRSELTSHFQSQMHSLSQTALEAKEQKEDRDRLKEVVQETEKRAQMSILVGTMEREREKARDIEKDMARQSEREIEEAAASRMKDKLSEVEETRRRLQLR